jgi:exodeoxyribonuclease X
MIIHVLDTETTGLDPAKDSVVEIASVELVGAIAEGKTGPTQWQIGDIASSYVNPHKPIPPEASGIHHILDADVADAPDLGEAIDHVLTPMWRESVDIVAAHNARFDRDFLPPLKDKRWIDTWRCALHVWPDAPSHANCALYYWRKFPRLSAIAHHSALFDATVTAHLLCQLLAERGLDELLKLSTKAAVLRKVNFGKHRGALWTEVPIDYLAWAAKQDFDPDVNFTIKTEMARRSAA